MYRTHAQWLVCSIIDMNAADGMACMKLEFQIIKFFFVMIQLALAL